MNTSRSTAFTGTSSSRWPLSESVHVSVSLMFTSSGKCIVIISSSRSLVGILYCERSCMAAVCGNVKPKSNIRENAEIKLKTWCWLPVGAVHRAAVYGGRTSQLVVGGRCHWRLPVITISARSQSVHSRCRH